MSRSTPRPSKTRLQRAAATAVERLECRRLFATFVWDGGAGADDNWTTPANWVGEVAPTGAADDILQFPEDAARKTNTNNFPDNTTFGQIQFTGTGGGYALGGAPITLGGNIASSSTGALANIVDLGVTLGAPLAFTQATGGTLRVSGDVNLGTNLLETTQGGTIELEGVVSGTGTGATGGIARRGGGGTTLIEGDNTYTGTTTVASGGTLTVNDPAGGTFATGLSNVSVSGSLRGNGSVGDLRQVTSTGRILPGVVSGGTGVIATEDIETGTGAQYTVNINGADPGTGYDQLSTTGAVDVSGVTLEVDTFGSGFTPTTNQQFIIVSNDGTDPVSGTFTGVAEGGTVTVGDGPGTLTVSYVGGDGNDVVLTNGTGGGGGGDAGDPPVNIVPTAAQTVAAGATLTFNQANNNRITVADADAGTSPIQVTLTATGGTIALGSETGLTVTDADGDATTAFTGTVDAVNAALAGLTYTAGATAGSGSLQIATSDQGATGTGGVQTDTDTVPITITTGGGGGEENDAPVITVPGAQTASQNTPLVFSTANGNVVSVADTDAAAGDVAVTLAATNGTINLGSTTGLTFTTGDGTGDANAAFTGTLAEVNAALNGLSFQPTTGFVGAGGLQVTVSDQGATGTGGAKTDTENVAITIGSAGNIAFSAANFDVDENAGVATVTVTRTDTAGAATVDVTTSAGTATEGDDYAEGTGTVSFADGAGTATFNVTIVDDIVDEDNETVTVTLSNPTGAVSLGAQTVSTVTIVDDDPTPTLTINNVTVAEGESETADASFTVLLSAASAREVTVTYAAGGGTAVVVQDYTATTGTLTFAPGETQQVISVPVVGDTFDEEDETFEVTLTAPTNATLDDATGTGTIVNDDADGPIGVFINDVIVEEGDEGSSDATFNVELSRALPEGITATVDYATDNGNATAGEDYGARTGTLSFSGTTTSQNVAVPITADTVDEPNETFTVRLTAPVNVALADATATGTIVDDDVPVGVTIDDVTITEGESGTSDATFTVTLTAASTQPVSVRYATADNTAIRLLDYTESTGTLSFAPGETTKEVVVPVVGDASAEPTETFFVNLSNPQNVTLTDAQGVGTIEDADAGAGPEAVDDQVTRPTGAAPVVITVLANDAAFAGQTVTVTLTEEPTNGTAVVNPDNTITYTPGTGSTASAPDFLTYRVSGPDGDAEGDVSIYVTGVTAGPNPSNPQQTALFIAGDTGANRITVGRRRTQLSIRIDRNAPQLFDIPTGQVIIVGGDGDDRITPGGFRGPVRIFGGNGNDRISGGRFSDVLIGGAGDDRIAGGLGRNIMIGGAGADRINGGREDDILISGQSDFDVDSPDNRTALAAIFNEWVGAGPYATRVTNITGTAGVGESGAGFNATSTLDDASEDRLVGGGGTDLFLANQQGGTIVDRVTLQRRPAPETLVDLTNE